MRAPKAGSLLAVCGGSAVIEFAMVAPIFLMLVFGSIEFGRLLWTQQALQQAAIAGARCMAIAQGAIQSSSCASSGSYNATSTKSYIESTAGGWGVSVKDADITLDNTATCGGTTGFSQVTITNTFNTPVPQLVQLAAGGTTLTATACYPNNPF
jgi:Flp pilus assembly protein TadG